MDHPEPIPSTSSRRFVLLAVLGCTAGCWLLAFSVTSTSGAEAPSSDYKDGAPPGVTGAFGQPTCHSCHFDQDLNNPNGHLSVSGLPASYRPDSTYLITVRVARPGLGRAGFALTARFDRRTSAGRLVPTDSTSRISHDGEETPYLTHTQSGSSVTGDTTTWRLRWTAPNATNRSTVFNLAANAANGDDSEFGDWIYTFQTIAEAGHSRPGAE